MNQNRLTFAACIAVALSLAACGSGTKAGNDAGKTSGTDAGSTDAGAVVADAGMDTDAGTQDTVPATCGTGTGSYSNTLVVKYTPVGGTVQTLSFGNPTPSVDYVPPDPNGNPPTAGVMYFDFTSADGQNYVIEIGLYEIGATFTCPSTSPLPIADADPYSIDLYQVDAQGTWNLLGSSLDTGASGTLKVQSFVTTSGSEEISFTCEPNCTLVIPPASGTGANVVTTVITGGIHQKI